MNFKKILLVAALFGALAVSGCKNTNPQTPPNPDPQTPADPGNTPETGNKYSNIMKDCGSKIMALTNESSAHSMKRGFAPYVNPPAQAIAMPGVYLYWSGLLNEIEGVDIINKAIMFSGKYKFNGTGGNVQDITFDLNVQFDEANNKFTFFGRQTIPSDVQYSYLVLTCDYNFTTNTMNGFTTYMQPQGFGSGNYIRYRNNTLESYSYYGTADGHESDPDFIESKVVVQNGINTLDALIANEDVLEGARLQSAIQAFVSASDYCDEVCEGINFDIEVITA